MKCKYCRKGRPKLFPAELEGKGFCDMECYEKYLEDNKVKKITLL